jgi:DNA-binding NarL/FixJ family response regulator
MPSVSKARGDSLVYLVEPHALAARLLTTVLKRNPSLEVIVSDTRLSPRVGALSERSVLVVDADALPFEPVPFLRTARMALGEVPVLVIGKGASDEELCRLLFHEVAGFVSYDKVEQEICEAVDALGRGRMWFRPEVLERHAMLSRALVKTSRAERSRLSPREAEVIGLLQRRLSNKEIGCALGISERTVRFHLQNIFEKLGVHDRHGAVDFIRTAASGVTGEEVAVWEAA